MKGDEGALGRSGLPGGIVRFCLLYDIIPCIHG